MTLDEISDRLAITDVLNLYARGIDRCDLETLRLVWWPGAIADYGRGPGDAIAWCEAIMGTLATMLRTQHLLSNITIIVRGDRAEAETYCQAYHELPGADGPTEMVIGGRYLDEFEKRGGAWRIIKRRYVHDWNRNGPSSAQWEGGIFSALGRVGARAPEDPLYTGA